MNKRQSILQKMRGLLCFLLLTVLMPSLNARPQTDTRITLNLDNVTLTKAMNEIKQQSRFLFINKGVDASRTVSIHVDKEVIDNVCKTLFTPVSVSYIIEGDNIIITNAKKPESESPVTISGVIKDASGQPVPGAGVIERGTSNGTVTDMDGRYSLKVSGKGATVDVNCLGYQPISFTVGNGTVYNASLNEDAISLEGTVVTALGIRKEEKSLSYNVQKVEGDIINTVKEANFVSSLQGKVAGLQINQSSSGAGGSTRVVMRGLKSITRSNNALYVIDGIPMPDLRSSQSSGIYETPDGGDFEGISNLNPEDIESMSVLSGASAAALYGAQGANGVILITTKKGQEGKLRVNFSNNTTFSSPFVTPEFQNVYGTSATEPAMSWGNKLETPTSYNPLDFFQTGFNTSNSIAVSQGNERSQTYVSAATLNSRGIIPNNTYNRYNFTIRNTTELVKDKLILDVSASYMRQYKRNPTIQGLYHNPLVATYLFPRGDDITKYQIFERYDANAGYMKQFWPLEFIDGVENPYWETKRELFENTAHRYTISGTLKWNITDWMFITGRARLLFSALLRSKFVNS